MGVIAARGHVIDFYILGPNLYIWGMGETRHFTLGLQINTVTDE